MATITIDFEEVEEDRRRRRLRRRAPLAIAAALGAMVMLAGDEERPPVIQVVEKPVRLEVPVPVRVEVPVATELYGPPKPVFVPAPKAPVPVPRRERVPDVSTVSTVPTTTVTTTIAATTTAPPPTPPPPDPPTPRPVLEPDIVPKHLHFTSSHWQRATISNPHPVPIHILSIQATGLNGAPVRGYNVDSRRCTGWLVPGASCHVTVFARDLSLRTRETIEIRVNTAAY